MLSKVTLCEDFLVSLVSLRSFTWTQAWWVCEQLFTLSHLRVPSRGFRWKVTS